MVTSFGAERAASFAGTSRSLFTFAAVIILSAFAKDTAFPAIPLPGPTTSVETPQTQIQPKEVLAPVVEPKLPSLTRIKSGLASWYGKVLQNHRTASGRRFDMNELTAAHRDLPFGSKVRVTDLRNHRSVVVTITDRGVLAKDRVIDLSYGAAKELKMIRSGVDPVLLEVFSAENVAFAVR